LKRIPKFWRRFKALMTMQDIIMERKVVVHTTLDDGTTHTNIEAVPPVEKTA